MFGKNRVAQWHREIRRILTKIKRIKGTITVSEPLVTAGQLDGRVLGGIVVDKVFFVGNCAF